MPASHRKNSPGGCIDPRSGLYSGEHFYLGLDQEMARLDSGRQGLGLIVFRFEKAPDWSRLGPKVASVLGSCDQAACLEEDLGAVFLPEVQARKMARILEDLGRELGPGILWGLALVWPGSLSGREDLLKKAIAGLAPLEKTLQRLIQEHGPFSRGESALIPAEKDSLFEGFGQLLGGRL
ncbi:MAG: hypothetical protein LBK52_00060 [Deltaproteobacteria bacterium]|jgi:hypothetical protein|nr:hypothetical protein [Deltaproteobacteria bacterium]